MQHRMTAQNVCELATLLMHLKVDISSFYCSGKDAKRMQARTFNPAALLTAIGLEVSVSRIFMHQKVRENIMRVLIQLLAILDEEYFQELKKEANAIGIVRVLENMLLVIVPTFYPQFVKPLVRVIRSMIWTKVAPYMARNRIEVVEFFLCPEARDLIR